VPASFKASIERRLESLSPTDRRVLNAAALLGRRFDWNLLPGIAAVDGRAAADGLRAAIDAQVIAADGDDFVFRHALSREAVLSDLLPFDRRELAARAWSAVELANPGLPRPNCWYAAQSERSVTEP
jgi:predicted ATPase